MQRLRIIFAKRGATRFIGNLDLHRAWERALRRAGAPLLYTQGYHPMPKIQLASALPLGITSEAEVVDVWLRKSIDLGEFLNDIGNAIPPGITVLQVTAVGLKEGSLQSRLRAAEYEVELPDKSSAHELSQVVAGILGRTYISRKRRGKNYDLRSLIEHLEINGDARGCITLRMRLTSQPGKTGRPEEVLDEMNLSGMRIHRTALFFVDNPD